MRNSTKLMGSSSDGSPLPIQLTRDEMASLQDRIEQKVADMGSEVNSPKTRRKRNESRPYSKDPSVRAQTGDRTENRRKVYRKAAPKQSTQVSNFEVS
jgi:hypothetical protein